MSSWSYGGSPSTGQQYWDSTPEERLEQLVETHPHGDDYQAVAEGDYSDAEHPDLENAGEAALWLAEGLKWINGNHNDKLRETLEWIASKHPVNEMGNERIWMKEGGKFDDFRRRLFSEETNSPRPHTDPLPHWARDQVTQQKEILISDINRTFWDIWSRQGYATVEDINGEISRDITDERVRQVLDSFVEQGELEKRDKPDHSSRGRPPKVYAPADEF